MDASKTPPPASRRSSLTPFLLATSAAASAVTAILYGGGIRAFQRWDGGPTVGTAVETWESWRWLDAAATSFELTAAVAWPLALGALAVTARPRTRTGTSRSWGRARWWLSLTAAAAAAIALGHLVQPGTGQLVDPGAIRLGYGLRLVGHTATALAMAFAVVALRAPARPIRPLLRPVPARA